MGSPFGNIEVRGARENNLKNISLDIPRRQITVFTGVSGSGKSFGTCLIRQAVRRRGPELAAEGRSVLIAEGTAMSMERPYGGQA
jgi:excinuclease UvrABC ATPase subunit